LATAAAEGLALLTADDRIRKSGRVTVILVRGLPSFPRITALLTPVLKEAAKTSLMKAIGWSKVVVFPVCLIPVAYLGLAAYQGTLGANPLEVITHTTGDWTIRFLLITLCITPLRQLSKQYWLVQYRRMFGLFAFFYGTLHLTTYLWFDKFFVWHDISCRYSKAQNSSRWAFWASYS